MAVLATVAFFNHVRELQHLGYRVTLEPASPPE
jgi:hypothetical protein